MKKIDKRGITKALVAVAEVRIFSNEIRGTYLHFLGDQTRHIYRTNWTDDSYERHRQEAPSQCRDGIFGETGLSEQGGGDEDITNC